MKTRLLPIFLALVMAGTMTTALSFAGEQADVQYGVMAACASQTPSVSGTQAIDSQLSGSFQHRIDAAGTEQASDASIVLPVAQMNLLEELYKDQKNNETLKACVQEDEEGYLKVYKPKPGQVFYAGETMRTKNSVRDTWQSYYTRSNFYTFNSAGEIVDAVAGDIAQTDTWTDYNGRLYLDPSYYSAGNYEIMFCNVPCYSDGTEVDNWSQMGAPTVIIPFKVKILLPPASLHIVSRSGGKITITFPKSAGATKYKLYRSTSVNGKFKCIKTGKKRKYLDTKVKKGRYYYYKVKAMRTKHGKVMSEFSSTWYVPAL